MQLGLNVRGLGSVSSSLKNTMIQIMVCYMLLSSNIYFFALLFEFKFEGQTKHRIIPYLSRIRVDEFKNVINNLLTRCR